MNDRLKILVCLKQVPDMESNLQVNAEGTWLDESDLAFRMNEYDCVAVCPCTDCAAGEVNHP
jgi:electron transfer flavoprotein beta subunit